MRDAIMMMGPDGNDRYRSRARAIAIACAPRTGALKKESRPREEGGRAPMKLTATARTVDRSERTRAQARKAARKRKKSAEVRAPRSTG